jgi:hypothetical protein
VSVLRRAYVAVEPDVSGFDEKLREKFAKVDPGGKAGKQLGGQLNRALKRLDLDAVDVRADPKKALAAIDATEARLQALSRNASTVEIKVRAEQALKEIGRFRKQLGDIGDDPEPARNFVAKFSARLGPLLASMPIAGPMSTALVGAGIAVAPLLGATVAGAIIGGVGIGGVVGGLSVAAKDTRVKAAADQLGDRIEGRLFAAAGAFVNPAIAGLKDIEKAADSVDIARIFRDSAKFVPVLSSGVSSLITDVGAALEDLIANGGAPVREIADGIALIGREASTGLRSLSDNAEGSAEALNTLFGIIGLSVRTTFQLVNALTELYEINRKIGGDAGLRLILKLTGAEMDATGESARRTGEGTFGMSQMMVKAEVSAEDLKKQQEALKVVQDALKVSQEALGRTLDSLGGKTSTAARTSDALRTAMDNLYGAAIRNTDANEAYEASWDGLSDSVKNNGRTLDINSVAGRSNRDVLQGLLSSNNDLYLANIAAGQSVDSARKKHENRTAAIIKEAEKLGFNEKKTRDLIRTYGQIPPEKATDLVVEGINQIVIELKRVYLAQRALAEGKTINEVRYAGTAAMRSLHTGGYTGDGGKYEPKGIVHGGEWVVNKETTAKVRRQAPGFLEELQATGQLPGYARGGLVAPVETSRYMRFPVDVSDSFVMSKAEALKRVAPVFGNWPSSPGAQRGDSGVWRKVLQLIKSGPNQGSFGNAFRPGDPKWHGSGRAVDWMGYNMDALASYLAAKGPLELIHRTDRRDYAYTRGKNKGSFNESLMNAHRNHIHIAMDDGGMRMLQPGMNLIPNGTGRPEPIAGPAAMAAMAGGNTYQITVQVPPTAHPAEVGKTLVSAIQAFEAGNGTRWRKDGP